MVDLERGMPGYAQFELPKSEELEGTDGWTPTEWQADFLTTRERISTALRVRDPYIVIARSAARLIMEGGKPEELHPEFERLEQAFVELLQAHLLIQEPSVRAVPTSPGSFVRLWATIARNFWGFTRRQEEKGDHTEPQRRATFLAQVQTLHYRNLFTRDDCERTMQALLARVDAQSGQALGYRLSDLFRAGVRLLDLVMERFGTYTQQVRTILTAKNRDQILGAIQFICECSPTAARAWRGRGALFPKLEDLRDAAFQLSELGYPWAFTLPRSMIKLEFSPKIVEALYGISVRPGELEGTNPDHLYLDNPVWRRPYVRLPNDDLFIPLPQLIFSFPFAIVEGLMTGHTALKAAYENARASYLEATIVDLVKTGMPSAAIYHSVLWDDPEEGKVWENDVVAVIGNFVFLFEAKSGGIKDAARRGGILSLEKNFKELFIEPSEQAGRLQSYLDTARDQVKLRLKATGEPIDLQMDRPKVVFSFSVCIEHFASLTSAKSYLKDIGLVTEEMTWSPVISLGELHMIVRFLDSEVSLIHYLTRRSTLEQVFDFHADEQDLLSAYLNNGLWIDGSQLQGQKIAFFKSDGAVRRPKTPRTDRTVVELFGMPRPPLWEATVREIYKSNDQRHRFDIINAILNQLPAALGEIEKRIRRYRRGEPLRGEDTFFVKYPIGKKQFAVMVHLEKRLTDPEAFQNAGRNCAMELYEEGGAVECATFFFARKAKGDTFSMASFFRLLSRPIALPH
ncbi:hypothetical protein [Caulobacter sp. NIBR2454]|uniref:hypothetical protein n=1 Tax=Caulobacter sp. NIBR2454 TaxID=3015996 RepID=UPI0022B670BD|nr:hypothetical protein [Caulobacter sp. NIBR2454]